MKLPDKVHKSRTWRIHEIASGFALEDVWALPARGGPADFTQLVDTFASLDPDAGGSRPARALWRARWQLGRWFGWDRPAVGASALDDAETALSHRVPEDLRHSAEELHFASLPFSPLILTDDEMAAQISNRTVHAIVHLAWVDKGDQNYQGQMAVYAKPHSTFGAGYMLAIKPFSHWVVSPALLRQIEHGYNARLRADRTD
ncbi:MAG: DUF2867 domain-containing protein [Ornithinimicrobium sp.]